MSLNVFIFALFFYVLISVGESYGPFLAPDAVFFQSPKIQSPSTPEIKSYPHFHLLHQKKSENGSLKIPHSSSGIPGTEQSSSEISGVEQSSSRILGVEQSSSGIPGTVYEKHEPEEFGKINLKSQKGIDKKLPEKVVRKELSWIAHRKQFPNISSKTPTADGISRILQDNRSSEPRLANRSSEPRLANSDNLSSEPRVANSAFSESPLNGVASTTLASSGNQVISKQIENESERDLKSDLIYDPFPDLNTFDLPVPILPPSYELTAEIYDVLDNEHFKVTEKETSKKARHSLYAETLNVTCIFNALTSEGYLVEGVKCSRYSRLPEKCFCTPTFCRPYISIAAVLEYLRSNKANLTKKSIGGQSNLELWSWSFISSEMNVEAVYSSIEASDITVEQKTRIPPTYDQLTPISFSVKGSGRAFLLPSSEIWLRYRVVGWSLSSDSIEELASTPPGVFCPAHERKFLPKIANQFSITMETIIENLATIAYETQHYESEEKLVAFTYRPHLHTEGLFMLNIPGLDNLSLESYRVVHDFKTGIQYMINEQTSNCSILAISVGALDAAPSDNQHVRLRHASELISINPNMFIYKGKRRVRGILCDVWVAERGVRKGRYSTVEVFFSHENWTIEVEVFNKVRRVPIGISTYVADADSPGHWTSIVHTFFYKYEDGHPSWKNFDIAPCLRRIDRKFLLLSLEVSYAELILYNVQMAKNTIRREIAGIAGVSPLRISDLYLSNRDDTGEVDVWFVLLEKANLSGPVMTPRPQLTMDDAYKLLKDITDKHNVSLKLDLSPIKKMFVTIKRGSLENSSDLLHPHNKYKKLRYMKAGYTAGSMAGLGFSMAIMGTCIGVLVGFLLWKRNPSVPYQVTD